MAPRPAPARPRLLPRGIINPKQTKLTSSRARAVNEIHQPRDKAVNYRNADWPRGGLQRQPQEKKRVRDDSGTDELG